MREKLIFYTAITSLVAAGVWGIWLISFGPQTLVAGLNETNTQTEQISDVVKPTRANKKRPTTASDKSTLTLNRIKQLIDNGQPSAAAKVVNQQYSLLSSDNLAQIKSLFLKQLRVHVQAKEYQQAQTLLLNASAAINDLEIWTSLAAISTKLNDWPTAVTAQLKSASLEIDPQRLEETLLSLVASASQLRAEYERVNDELSIASLYKRLSAAHPGYARFELELAQSHLRLGNPELALPLLEQLQYDSELGPLANQKLAALRHDKQQRQDEQQAIEQEQLSAALQSQGNRGSDVLVPLTRIGNSFLVTTSVNGRSLSLLLDTGASITALSTDLIRRLNLEPTGRSIQLNTANGITSARLFKVQRVRLGRLSIKDLIVAEIDLKQSAGFQGLLGTDLLNRINANYSYLIDNQQNALIFRRR